MTRPRLLLATLLFLTALLPACSFVQSPQFEVESFTVKERSDLAAILNITLLGTNPSKHPLEMRNISYSITLNNLAPISSARHAQSTIPARSQLRVMLPVVLDIDTFRALEGSETSYQLRGSVSYLRPGKFAEVLYDLGIKRASKKIAHDGTLLIPEENSQDAGS